MAFCVLVRRLLWRFVFSFVGFLVFYVLVRRFLAFNVLVHRLLWLLMFSFVGFFGVLCSRSLDFLAFYFLVRRFLS